MSSYYGVIYSRYWTGQTGIELRERGGKDAQLLGVYLISNSYMNMLGLYALKLRDVRDELGLPPAALVKAFAALHDATYADYDERTSFVWVREMARFRLNITDEKPLKKDDNKCKGAQRLYAALPGNPFLGPFFDRYARQLHLKQRREGTPQHVGLQRGSEGASKGLQRGFEASIQNQDQNQDQVQAAAAPPRPPSAVENPDANVSVITKIAHEAIDQLGPAHPDISETVKSLCARRRISYSSGVVRKAIDSAITQQMRKRE